MAGFRRLIVGVGVVGLAGAGYYAWSVRPKPPTPPAVTPVATTPPVTRPATVPTAAPVVKSFVDVVRANYPDFPTTQPLGVPLDYSEAAHIVFKNPVYLSPPPRSDLWVTHPEAPAVEDVIRDTKNLARQQTFVTRDQVLHVHWMNAVAPDDDPKPIMITGGITWKRPIESAKSAIEANEFAQEICGAVHGVNHDPADDEHFERAVVAWGRAGWFDNMMVLPGGGTAVIWEINHRILIPDTVGYRASDPPVLQPWRYRSDLGPSRAPVYFVPDAASGLLVWSPGISDTPGSVARFFDRKFTTLPASDGWSSCALQLVPLLDGSVLQIAAGPTGNEDLVDLKLIPLTPGGSNVDEKRLAQLVDQLTDLSQRKRDAATDELSRYGPEAWPILEKLIVDQPPEVLLRMKRVMGNRLQPTLAGMKLIDGRMKLVTRLSDGGCVFYANSGVSIARREGGEDVVAPAWICVRPGRAISRLPDALVRDLNPDHATLDAFEDEWVVTDDAQGPRRLLGNRLVKLLRDDERVQGFDTVVGVDRRGRWLFRKSVDPVGTGSTLIVDPTLPDPTPKLPAWTFAEAKEVGWTRDGWPAVRKGSTWSLREDGWQLEKPEAGGEMQTRVERLPSTPIQPNVKSSSTTTTSPSPEDRYGPPILTLPDGSRVFDGYTKLVVDNGGNEIVWPLPADVVGRPPFPVTLLVTKDGVWFLFNQPGRVIRFKRTADAFKVEATFTKDVPVVESPTRTWLDPAGRIALLWDNKVTVFFPEGRIPAGIRNLMTGTPDE